MSIDASRILRASNDNPVLISLNETAKLTSMSRSMVNVLRADGKFPQPVALGERRIAFVRAEVSDWIAARIAARPARAA